jgi:NosR/NirI family nitrous oxide reductase transcriptional regulator
MADLLKLSFEFSPKLGVRDLPRLGKNHESNIKGMYIVGDLADAPIIKVALSQGHTVAKALAKELGAPSDKDELDVAIVGAGPAGIGAALGLRDTGLRHAIFERENPFSTIQNFPKGKLIFSEPHEIQNPDGFWFDDAAKDDLVDRWNNALNDEALDIRQPVEVLDIRRQKGSGFELTVQERDAESTQTIRARRVILAVGKRGQTNHLGVPGEDLPHVHHAMKDAELHTGQRVIVVGGGDTAIETAVSLADAGAKVVLCYRGSDFHRPKARNLASVTQRAEAGKIDLRFNTQPTEITSDSVTLTHTVDGTQDPVAADIVFLMVGFRMPLTFLRRLGIRMQGEMDALRVAWIAGFAAFSYFFYCLKSKKTLFPFGDDDPLGWMHQALEVDLGFRQVDAAFWGTLIFAVVILVFGLRAYFKYPSKTQKNRYLSLIAFQWIFLFGVPELLAPLVIDRPWKMYAIAVPWPLSIWSLVDAPGWAGGSTRAAVSWIMVGAFVSFVAIPLYVRKQGQRFCSYMCGCGGLAETLGDLWRHMAPRGRTAKQAESMGRIILLLAIPVTLLILNDAWHFVASEAFADTAAFAQQWYGLMVDFWLASVVGVALYPYLGNRVWCRFFCPLRAYMEEISRRFSRIAIKADDRCIGCGECTRYCQMGIPVQTFAQKQVDLSNRNSACIQCGICVEVCPMNVLEIDFQSDLPEASGSQAMPPRAAWEH